MTAFLHHQLTALVTNLNHRQAMPEKIKRAHFTILAPTATSAAKAYRTAWVLAIRAGANETGLRDIRRLMRTWAKWAVADVRQNLKTAKAA